MRSSSFMAQYKSFTFSNIHNRTARVVFLISRFNVHTCDDGVSDMLFCWLGYQHGGIYVWRACVCSCKLEFYPFGKQDICSCRTFTVSDCHIRIKLVSISILYLSTLLCKVFESVCFVYMHNSVR